MSADRDVIRRALLDAIGWQDGLANAYAHIPDAPERKAALAQIAAYRRILKKRYGDDRTPQEHVTDGAPSIDIRDIAERDTFGAMSPIGGAVPWKDERVIARCHQLCRLGQGPCPGPGADCTTENCHVMAQVAQEFGYPCRKGGLRK